MATYAEINTGNIVVNIIVADAEFVATQPDKQYVEYDNDNPAGIGYTYDADADVFVAPRPYPSWTLDDDYQWQAPVPYPDDNGNYVWDEATQQWAAI